MEATVLSVGKSVLNGALSYAKSAAAEEVALQLGVKRDQAFITDELEMMQGFLMAAYEERDDNKVVKIWVKQVRDVSYDVEDCLMDFAVRLQKQSLWQIPRTLLVRRSVAKKMKDLRAKVEDVSQRNLRYRIIKGSSSKPAITAGQYATASATMSGTDIERQQREKAKVDLVRLLNIEKDDNLRVLAMWGTSADLGEKSVIKNAYEELKKNKKFVQCHAWIRLMCPFDLTELLQSIVRQFYLNSLQEGTTEAQDLRNMGMLKGYDLAVELERYMNDKSYLIVLNDLLSIKEWNHIKLWLPNNKKGSRIILSTRQVEVASLCIGPESAPEHKQLDVDKALHVFYQKGSQDGSKPLEAAGSSSNKASSSSNDANKNCFTRTGTIATFNEAHLIGREKEKSAIIKLITNEHNEQFGVISVWGMGGLGKTTLVRDVYQSQELYGKYDKTACITIMRPFNRDELLSNLDIQLNAKDAEKKKQLGLEGKPIDSWFASLLEGNKYLIVLDDLLVSSEWDALLSFLPQKEKASRIIVTTRIEDVAKHCSKKQENIYNLQCLGDKEARDLFSKKVFGNITDFHDQYSELAEQASGILKKCNGLPLAIVTIGGFLANQPKTNLEWTKLNENISAELEMNPELGDILTVLHKSYDGLPYYLKPCFLYLSIFSEDQEVSRRRLARRWSAEGYPREVRGKSAGEVADNDFMELISRSMILPSQRSVYSRKGIDSCQVHDLIRDISILKSSEENLVFRLEDGCSLNMQSTVRHITVSSNWKRDKNEYESIVDLSRVRSLTVFGEWKSFFISDQMKLLRVLDLEDTSELCAHHLGHIGKLLHLKYLSLRGNGSIFHLPDSLGNLRQLETLDIRGTEIKLLPKTIIKLRKLQYLCAGSGDACAAESILTDFLEGSFGFCLGYCYPQYLDIDGFNRHDVCTAVCCSGLPSIVKGGGTNSGGVIVPRGTGQLKALRTLGYVNLARGNAVAREIRRLIGLRKLRVCGINKGNSAEFCSAISDLSRLESLSVKWYKETCIREYLDDIISPPKNLQSLKLIGRLDELPKWIPKLQNLVKLKLSGTMVLNDAAMQVLGNLPSLSILRLFKESLEGGEELHFQSEAFKSLVVLELYGWSNDLKTVKFDVGAMPKLEQLQLTLGLAHKVAFWGLDILASLKEVLLDIDRDDVREQVRIQLAENPNKPILKWGRRYSQQRTA